MRQETFTTHIRLELSCRLRVIDFSQDDYSTLAAKLASMSEEEYVNRFVNLRYMAHVTTAANERYREGPFPFKHVSLHSTTPSVGERESETEQERGRGEEVECHPV